MCQFPIHTQYGDSLQRLSHDIRPHSKQVSKLVHVGCARPRCSAAATSAARVGSTHAYRTPSSLFSTQTGKEAPCGLCPAHRLAAPAGASATPGGRPPPRQLWTQTGPPSPPSGPTLPALVIGLPISVCTHASLVHLACSITSCTPAVPHGQGQGREACALYRRSHTARAYVCLCSFWVVRALVEG